TAWSSFCSSGLWLPSPWLATLVAERPATRSRSREGGDADGAGHDRRGGHGGREEDRAAPQLAAALPDPVGARGRLRRARNRADLRHRRPPGREWLAVRQSG